MATSNFSRPNLSKVYAFGADHEDDIDFDIELSNIIDSLSEIKDFYKVDKWTDRNTHAFGAFDFRYYDRFYESWNEVSLYLTVESGYYSGAMIDVDFSDIEDIVKTKTLEKQIQQKCNAIEKVLEKITTPLVRVATFSNGETIYEVANTIRGVALGTS